MLSLSIFYSLLYQVNLNRTKPPKIFTLIPVTFWAIWVNQYQSHHLQTMALLMVLSFLPFRSLRVEVIRFTHLNANLERA